MKPGTKCKWRAINATSGSWNDGVIGPGRPLGFIEVTADCAPDGYVLRRRDELRFPHEDALALLDDADGALSSVIDGDYLDTEGVRLANIAAQALSNLSTHIRGA